MTGPALEEYRYEKLTWPDVNEAVAAGKIALVPVGAVEQHGPHLPLDVDMLLSTSVALETGKRNRTKAVVLPSVSYGYTGHVMDFPGTINIHYTHFIEHVLDICKSLAYHGFKKILLLNGHGSNMPNLDLVARRCNLETDAECAFTAWWLMLTVDPEFLPRWRESHFPGGCAHACELETSMYLHIAPEDVRKDKIRSDDISYNTWKSRYRYTDLFGAGPVSVTSWTASYSDTGVLGDAELATAEKGRQAFEEAVTRLGEFIDEWYGRPAPPRKETHTVEPTMPMPWGQASSLERRR
ncbi:MAG: creatininase family protein [Pirellulales bacterium]|nr:creatininase family protein [Pirellulales bacterium]